MMIRVFDEFIDNPVSRLKGPTSKGRDGRKKKGGKKSPLLFITDLRTYQLIIYFFSLTNLDYEILQQSGDGQSMTSQCAFHLQHDIYPSDFTDIKRRSEY